MKSKIKSWLGAWWGGWLVGILDFGAFLIVVAILVVAVNVIFEWFSSKWQMVAVPTVLFGVGWTALRVASACIDYRKEKQKQRDAEERQKRILQEQSGKN